MKPTDYLALSIATCGVGYLPLAPGTFGSLVSVGLFLLLARAVTGNALVLIVLVSIAVVTFAGIWAGSRIEQLSGRKDPGKVVIDEVAGQLIALFPLTLFARWSTAAVIVSFILFRFFDIVKPYPANRLQEVDGGMGIMFDDLLAGVYGAVVVSIFLRIF
ncbi:MAG TPA: phosphatidylglycerophosphatase A [Pyrinomonadaceae bacterium]|nr:phosphatidylglycerophosphatase A [Pyrinomonadaceae bacterium]